jgi:peptidoglycan-associated lipoprotein
MNIKPLLVSLSVVAFLSACTQRGDLKSSQDAAKSSEKSSGLMINGKYPRNPIDESTSVGKATPDRIFFDTARSDMSLEASMDAKAQASAIAARNGANVTVSGYCDQRGGVEYNLALGERRANAVKEELVKNGVSSEKVKTVSFGKEKMLVPGVTSEALAQNRVAITTIS